MTALPRKIKMGEEKERKKKKKKRIKREGEKKGIRN